MGIKFGLDNITRLLGKLGDPHRRFRSVHVAGSNGKGSVSAMTAAVLQEAGYVTGLYTSPHLVDFRERIRVDGTPIPEVRLLRLVEEVREIAESATGPEERLTFFELTTGIAFAHFADSGVEEAVVEVGMGGRLDATNVLSPDCCAITRIGLEHTRYLGSTLEAIAGEKAGIIKPGVPVVTIDQEEKVIDVFRRTAGERNAPLKVVGRDVAFEAVSSTLGGTEVRVDELDATVRVPLVGRYQASNCALACGVVAELMLDGDDCISVLIGPVEYAREKAVCAGTCTGRGGRSTGNSPGRQSGRSSTDIPGWGRDGSPAAQPPPSSSARPCYRLRA